MKFTYEKISDDAYAVFDGDKQHCAVFNYVDTPDHNLPTGVHLDISITPSLEVEKLFLGGATAKEIDYLAGIFSFVPEHGAEIRRRQGAGALPHLLLRPVEQPCLFRAGEAAEPQAIRCQNFWRRPMD